MEELTYIRLGIIADSHGNHQMIELAVDFLKRRRCDRIIHLGDICDSFRPQTCDACLDILIRHNVIAVKGNNDHVLEINQTGNSDPQITGTSLDFLKRLPPTLSADQVIFAHSLPFYRELGISCITKPMGNKEVEKFFLLNAHQILFRGHSHSPSLKFNTPDGISRLDMPPGEKHCLKHLQPCVVTCGALTRGLVMIWEADSQVVSSLSIK